MERVYINRECCIAYVVLTLHSIYKSANKERRIKDFIEEIKTMFEIYEDEEQLMQLMKEILNEDGEKRVRITNTYKKKMFK